MAFSPFNQGIFQTTPPTLSVGDISPVELDNKGNQKVVAQTGSTTAVTGNVTAVQTTGTNLHTVTDSGSTTAVTGNVTVVQGTGANLHSVLDSGTLTSVTNPVTVQQSTGTNLHAVIDSGPMNLDSTKNALVNFGPGAADAFGRGRVSTPTLLFTTNFIYDQNPLTVQISNTGTGTATKTSNQSSLTLSTGGTGANAGTIVQSHGYYRYEPGKSQLINMTGALGAYTQFVRKQIGYFDANDGMFFSMNGFTSGPNAGGATGLPAVVQRSSISGSPVDTFALQSSWNIDKMDGTGVSGITLDFTKTQIFAIDLQWLGVGRVRFGFVVNGLLYYCHQFQNANTISTPYANSAVLPIRWQIANDPSSAPAGTSTMLAICGSIISEGGEDSPNILIFSADQGITGLSATTTLKPMLSIRPRLTINSITNRVVYNLLSGTILNASNNAARWALVYNGTLTGASFADVNTTYSGMQADTSATAISGGVVVASGYIQPQNLGGGIGILTGLNLLSIPFSLDIAGTTQDVYSLCGQTQTGSGTMYGQLSFSEDR